MHERLKPAEIKTRLRAVRGWKLIKGKALRRELVMQDFLVAVAFIHDVAQAAESQGHHPDLHLTDYRNLTIELTTHDAGGLTLDDFILAEKIDALPRKLKKGK